MDAINQLADFSTIAISAGKFGAMQEWEYKLVVYPKPETESDITLTPTTLEGLLNSYGHQGWELITYNQLAPSVKDALAGRVQPTFVLKRRCAPDV